MYHCPECGYKQDFEMTAELARLHFPERPDLKAGECPVCRALLEPRDIAAWIKQDPQNVPLLYDYWQGRIQRLFAQCLVENQITEGGLWRRYRDELLKLSGILMDAGYYKVLPDDAYIQDIFNQTKAAWKSPDAAKLGSTCRAITEGTRKTSKQRFVEGEK